MFTEQRCAIPKLVFAGSSPVTRSRRISLLRTYLKLFYIRRDSNRSIFVQSCPQKRSVGCTACSLPLQNSAPRCFASPAPPLFRRSGERRNELTLRLFWALHLPPCALALVGRANSVVRRGNLKHRKHPRFLLANLNDETSWSFCFNDVEGLEPVHLRSKLSPEAIGRLHGVQPSLTKQRTALFCVTRSILGPVIHCAPWIGLSHII